MENKKRFLSLKDMTRKDFGRNAVIGILGGGLSYSSGYVIMQVLGSVISLAGFICAVIWLYRVITHKA